MYIGTVPNLASLPHDDARALLRGGATVYVPVNPVEYHGPHLSLHNDALVSRGLIDELAARLQPGKPPLVVSDLEVGVEPCAGPGSRHTPYRQVSRLVREACRALCEMGATRIVLMTFHGSPLHGVALDDGIEECRRHGARAFAPLAVVMRHMLELDDPSPYAPAVKHVRDAQLREELLTRLPLDFHAGFFETSVALHYAPDSVSAIREQLPPCPEIVPDAGLLKAAAAARRLGRRTLARELGLAAAGKGWNALRPFPGYTSRPALATREAGAFFAQALVDALEPVARAVLHDGAEPPRPILAWLRALTLEGRIATTDVPVDAILRVRDLGVVAD